MELKGRNLTELDITGERSKFRQLKKFTFDYIVGRQQWGRLKTIFKDTNTKLIKHMKIPMKKGRKLKNADKKIEYKKYWGKIRKKKCNETKTWKKKHFYESFRFNMHRSKLIAMAVSIQKNIDYESLSLFPHIFVPRIIRNHENCIKFKFNCMKIDVVFMRSVNIKNKWILFKS